MFLYIFVAFSIALVVALAWVYFEDRNAAIREATRRAKRGTPKSIGGTVSLHGRIAIPTAYRVNPLDVRRKRSPRSTA